MSASLDERLAVLARIETKQVQSLLGVLSQAVMRRSQFIEAAFDKEARYFRETLQFVKDIGWVREQQDELILTPEGNIAASSFQDETKVRKRLSDALTAEDSPYQSLVADFLVQFRIADSRLEHQPVISDRLLESPLRNFLMDIRVVAYLPFDDLYVLNEDAIELYVWAKNLRRPMSRRKLEEAAKDKEELGSAAEIAAFEFEKTRVGAQWASKVEHVSASRPLACYDIKSVTLHEGTVAPRYIEVKAVTADSFQFFWTASEVETARLLRSKYFLYLLPVVAGSGFNLKGLVMLQDPSDSVLQHSDTWLIEENVVKCTRRRQA